MPRKDPFTVICLLSTRSMAMSVIDKAQHSRKRKLISQGLGDAALRTAEPKIQARIDVFLKQLAEVDYAAGQAFKAPASARSWGPKKNMSDACNFLTFDVFSDLLLGKSFGMLTSTLNRFIIRGVASSSKRAGIFLQMPWLTNLYADLILFPDTAVWRSQFFQTVVDISTERLAIKEGRQDIFQLIQDARDPETGAGMSMNELVSECTLLIVAGSDTSSTTLAAAFFYLAKNPHAHQRLADEICKTFRSLDDIQGGAELNGCAYLRASIDEALRLSPPVGGAPWREAQRGGANVDGHRVPAGYDAGVGTYAMHHSPQYYPRPFDYCPERWLGEGSWTPESVQKAKSAFHPFSLGPRGCPGKSLAYLEISLALERTLFLYDFRFANPDDANASEYVLTDHFTSAKDGPQLVFKKRVDA
ncbi:hypothetical protein W97_07919 [Coniosporium apollinis CBS 100218]|uniref:Cytochrome P450 monooxygenase n=1 Tax=Coniosporium apollinis (strain CBS 100218) TaxID=1168221 RepID=R7Z430_CONA1|nr:uncharacterized protein W97_07919 [Coniosporium apollinis CBS 100218]EON68661.1 hypothetical protein W97_07919 [Coniosporium apollinis CBS 100218]